MTPADILKKPYSRVLIPDETGVYSAEIFEFPGCVAVGDTAAEALTNLEDVANDWVMTALEQGQDIPDPIEANDFSGKLVLRMPSGLHKRATMCAEREGVSLNQFIVTCLAEAVGERAKQRSVSFHPQVQAVATMSFVLTTGVPQGQTHVLTTGQGGIALAPATMMPIQYQNEKTNA